jgi:transcriptional regulator with GAF, ATPase, and Fis domain
MHYSVPFRFWGRDDSGESRIRQSVSAAGLELTSFGDSEKQPYGILAFSEMDQELVSLLRALRRGTGVRVLALAVRASVLRSGDVWRLLQAGAADVMEWIGESVAQQVFAKVERCHLVEQVIAQALEKEPLAGESAVWRELVRRVVEAGRFSSAPVLLTGESGTGKEHLARLVHAVAPRGDAGRENANLVTVDCTTIVPELSGSELFGHEKGAFTGAHSVRDGAFALANEGTLFLDEVGELSLPLQAQLLRAVQEKTYKRVGGNIWLRTSFRLVCATNRDLEDLVRRGQFRLDLYHRIAGWIFRTPRIGERREDILPLARYFLSTIFPQDQPRLDAAVCEYLQNRMYPGNIRELRQLLERMAHRHAGPGPITVGDIPEEDRPADGAVPLAWPDERLESTIADAIALGASLKQINSATTAAAIRIAVQSEKGNLQRAAKRLGVTDRALQMRRAAGMIPD